MSMSKDTHGGDSIAALEGFRYTITAVGKQADEYTTTTKAIGDYAGRVFGATMRTLIMSGKDELVNEPAYPTDKDDAAAIAKWAKQYDLFLKKTDTHEAQKGRMFSIILGQCDKAMRNRIETHDDYDKAERRNDVVTLLRTIKDIAFDANEMKYPPMQATIALRNLLKSYQQDDEDLNDYYKRFTSLVELVERQYGDIIPTMVAEKDSGYAKANASGKKTIIKAERDKMLAYIFMSGAHYKLYGTIMKNLNDEHALGETKYPETIEQALQVLSMKTTISVNELTKKKRNDDPTEQLQFTQFSRNEMRKRGLCFKCGKKWHKGHECESDGSDKPRDNPQFLATTMEWQA